MSPGARFLGGTLLVIVLVGILLLVPLLRERGSGVPSGKEASVPSAPVQDSVPLPEPPDPPGPELEDLREMPEEVAASPLALRSEQQPEEVRPTTSGIVGTVSLPADEPGLVALVAAEPVRPGKEPGLDALDGTRNTRMVKPGQTDFEFQDLKPGTYVVGVRRSSTWRGFEDHRVVTVEDDAVRCDLELPPLAPGSFLLVRATGPDGAGLSDLRFHFRYETGGRGSAKGGLPATLQPDGAYRIVLSDRPRPPSDPWGPEEYFLLSVESERYGAQQVSLQEGQRKVEVVFGAPAFVDVVITRFEVGPCADRLEVAILGVAEQENDTLSSKLWNRVPQEGALRLGPFVPGDHRLVLALAALERPHERREVSSSSVSLHAGENSPSVPMPALGDLSVRVPAGGKRQCLFLKRAGDPWVQFPGMREADVDQWPDAEGLVTFSCLPPGDYVIQGEEGSMVARVPAAGEVLFDPRSYDAMKVSITNPSGLLAQWGLHEGDLLLAVDGKELDHKAVRDSALSYLRFQESAVLTVSRGGTVVEIPVQWPGDSDADQGGSLEPAFR